MRGRALLKLTAAFAAAGLLTSASATGFADAGDGEPGVGSSQTALSQSIDVEERSPVGTPITLEVTVVHPRDTEVFPPESFGGSRWEMISSTSTQTATETQLTTVYTIVFGVYRPGESVLQELEFAVEGRDGTRDVLTTDPVEIIFLSEIDDATEFLGPQPHREVWVEDYTLAWVGGLTGAAALGTLTAFLIAARRREEEEIIPERPAHEIALEKLGRLSIDDLESSQNYMMFYVRLSEAIREYLGRVYGFPGLELTTSEIRERLEAVVWPRGITSDEVLSLLSHCDSVKFAGRIPSTEQARRSLRRAFSIVELTRKGRQRDEDVSAESQHSTEEEE